MLESVKEILKNHPFELLPFDDHGWFDQDSEQTLKRWILEIRPRTVLEIGSWMGRSTRFFASQVEKVVCVDTWKGSKEHLEDPQFQKVLPRLYEQFLSNCIHFGLIEKIFPLRGKSIESLEWLRKNCPEFVPDLVFVDGSHEYGDVFRDIKVFQEEFPKALLCGDDWFWEDVQRAVQDFSLDRDFQVECRGQIWSILNPVLTRERKAKQLFFLKNSVVLIPLFLENQIKLADLKLLESVFENFRERAKRFFFAFNDQKNLEAISRNFPEATSFPVENVSREDFPRVSLKTLQELIRRNDPGIKHIFFNSYLVGSGALIKHSISLGCDRFGFRKNLEDMSNVKIRGVIDS